MVKINRRKFKDVANTAISGTLASSILASSCTFSDMDGVIYDEYKPNTDLGNAALPMSVDLIGNDAKYVNAIRRICIDVIQDQSIAQQVAENPESMFKKYGYDGPIDMDSDVLKIIKMLGDDEINEAIANKDISKFIVLCEDRGLLYGANKDSILQKYNDQIKSILQNGQIRTSGYYNDQTTYMSVIYDIFFVAGAVTLAAVLAAVVAGVEVAFNVHFVAHANTYIVSKNNVTTTPYVGDDDGGLVRDTLTVMNVASLKSSDSYQMFEEYYGEVADEMIQYIESSNPRAFSSVSKEDFKRMVIASIISTIQNTRQNEI